MTDYWKSYAKKFCEICKVWYADNKISSERHEMGTKHKIMVQQRLRESSKKARDKEAADHDLRMTLLGMEQAARASLGEGKQRRIPRVPAEEEIADYPTALLEPEEFDPKAELREQRRMLKDLKSKSKQSQLWVDDNEAKQEVQDTVDEMVWVQAETPGAVRYYWHIYSGETRWDQPKHFYTSEEYAERYTEIAAKIASQNQIIAESAGQLFQLPSSSGTTKQLTSTEQNYSHFHSSQMIAPKYAPEMSMGETDSRGGTKRGPRDDYERGNELSKEERKRIKRERIAMAEAEGPPQKPEGLVELMERPTEEIKPEPIQMNMAEATDTTASTTTNHPYGPWIPVKKKETDPKIESESEQKEKKKKHFDDLPEQGYGPGSSMLANAPAELLEVAEMDPEELAFRPKEVPTVERSKKSSKGVVGFRRPAGNSANKSLRNRAN